MESYGAIENCVHQNHFIRVRSIEANSDFINLFWNSPVGAREVSELAVTSSGLYSLSAGKIRAFAIPVPPIEEQREIVRRASSLLELAEAQLSRVDAAAWRVERSSEAILAKAFSGELSDAVRRCAVQVENQSVQGKELWGTHQLELIAERG